MNKKITILISIFLLLFLAFSCNDSNDESEPELDTFLCCGENPFANLNVDNLDQNMGEITATGMLTPNGDGLNDHFEIQNIEFYPNNSVTIYDLDDNIVFETQSYNDVDETTVPYNPTENAFIGLNQVTSAELEFGSYKYKIVIENEDTFLEYGYFCLIRNFSEANGFIFSNCSAEDPQDPLLL